VRFNKVNIEISNICNLQCSFCPPVERAGEQMSEALFRRVVEQVAPVTDQVCLHLMGEPLAHPRLAQLVEICSERRVPIFFVTNGTLLRPDKAELLLQPIFRQVNFSLHSFFDNYPDGDPSTYLERIFSYTERALVERPDLYINFRLWNLEAPRGVGERNREMLRRVEARFAVPVADAAGLRKSRRLKGRLYLHFDTEFTWPALDLDHRGVHGTCKGLSTHIGVLADGTVVPCCLDKEGVIALGDLKTQPLIQILESPRALAMLRGFQQGRLTEELCQHCPYIERFSRSETA
jgi:MoaA/NifB/PqqE/SkfB family radical SAM enzyme